MRKIERAMSNAVRSQSDWHSGNTYVCRYQGYSTVQLHGNHIATVYDDGDVDVNIPTLRQWDTVTTRSRLRALGANVRRVNGRTLVNDVEI